MRPNFITLKELDDLNSYQLKTDRNQELTQKRWANNLKRIEIRYICSHIFTLIRDRLYSDRYQKFVKAEIEIRKMELENQKVESD